MKFFLLVSVGILSVLLATANEPFNRKLPYTLSITDSQKQLNFSVPTSVGTISYFSTNENNETLLTQCLAGIDVMNQEHIKRLNYNNKQIDADITVFVMSKNDDLFKAMVIYSKLDDNSIQNKSTENLCNSLNGSYSTKKWMVDLSFNKITSIALNENNQLYLKIAKYTD